MSGHTPGPWNLFEFQNDGVDPYPGVVASDRADIVIWGARGESCGVRGDTDEQALANARLIAAAPDLLAALQNIRSSHQSQHNESEAWGWVDAAIAKATQP